MPEPGARGRAVAFFAERELENTLVLCKLQQAYHVLSTTQPDHITRR